MFRLLVLLLPLLLAACEAGTAGHSTEMIESPLRNTCQPADGHDATTPVCAWP
jgi:hypothetical protein